MTLELGKALNDAERTELLAMYALIVQTEKKYVQDAKRRGVLSRDHEVTNWFQSVDDAESQGWQSALSAMSHVFGELRHHHEVAAQRRQSQVLSEGESK